MVRTLQHRGPDGNGRYVDQKVAFGHARLSIIDLAGGAQPIRNETSDVWITFNGEIFNHIELRADLLRRGHAFYTHSDTEVIVHLYEEFGDDFVDHLNGQFALAIWDLRRQRVVLARDRTGIRPLFHTRCGGRLLFASEVKALFVLPEVPRRLEATSLAQIFSYWGTLGDATPFENIHSLPPGHMMVIDRSGTSVRKYWDWDFDPDTKSNRSEGDLAAELKGLLIDAVRLQLRADVPVGAYLSGGLDSSIITSLIRNHTETPLRSFSLTFEEPEFDESHFQQELARYLGTEHSTVRVTRGDIAQAFPRTIWHAETPIVRTAPTPLLLLSRHVREAGFKVVLTGEGADEVFGGYDLFKEAKIRRFMARHPDSRWRHRILERLYPYLRTSPVAGAEFARRFFADGSEHRGRAWFAHHPRMTTTRRALRFLRPDLHDRVAGWDVYGAIDAMMPARWQRWEEMHRDQYVEAHTLLPGYLLSSQGDRVAMANSIEGRVPFLDHRVIEFANRLPPQFKLRTLVEKSILKKSMRGELPEVIRTRAKQPYRAPDCTSFFVDGLPVDYVAELMSPARIEAAGVFDVASVSKLMAKCSAGRAVGFADNMSFVGILSTMLIHDQFIRPAAFDGAMH